MLIYKYMLINMYTRLEFAKITTNSYSITYASIFLRTTVLYGNMGSDQNISRDIWCEMFWWRGKGRQNILNDFIAESTIMRNHKIVL